MKFAGDEEKWDKVWSIYLNATSAQEKSLLMNSLSAITERWMLNRLTNN